MAPKSRRQLQAAGAIEKRWSPEQHSLSDEDIYCIDISTDDELSSNYSNLKERINVSDIGDIYELCKTYCSTRYLSVLIYLTLRHFNVSCRDTDAFLKDIGSYTRETSHNWSWKFLNGNFDEFINDKRGGKRGDSFYDIYPELEEEARAFAVIQCNKKAASFTAYELAQFIDNRYYEINDIQKNDLKLVRSVECCRLDLRRWGAHFDINSNRPYFEGHERSDVREHREQFVRQFLTNQDSYYTVNSDEDPSWNKQKSSRPTILICHDESTFRSGDVCRKRWFLGDSTPFFSKGRGRSVMVSDFLVQHPSGPFFQLDEQEWTKAIRKYPELLIDDGIRYVKYSATVFAHLGVDSYFDNSVILLQFERLFKLIEFKQEYQTQSIEILVDNATTHTAKSYSINDFGKNIGTNCPVSSIEYLNDNNEIETLDCYFQSGPHIGQSKGLLVIARELGIQVPSGVKLNELKVILSNHKAFQNNSKLENLAKRYNIEIKFIPKFHCELNPIEGMWCHQKQFVRKHSDQTFQRMLELIHESRENFTQKMIFLKLFRRFWRTIYAYARGQSYEEVLKLYFGDDCSSTVISHRKVTNSNLSKV
ncbi:unnamed protein product [Rotaria magnacalcarata]|uniref:Uncharacterized protein n=1 Tax=Rotaria magnacalcarata TaxID=392030 RepID=A0A820JN75_9BILA|nr:unnamed protein product [Rotaria magnacalcarata]CAF4327552.1 unnamed protein product [Rotaria magnacalcarata]